MKKILLLLQEFDYSKIITYDAGPGYATSMGWERISLERQSSYLDSINIIDNRITEAECFKLEEYLERVIK